MGYIETVLGYGANHAEDADLLLLISKRIFVDGKEVDFDVFDLEKEFTFDRFL